MSRSLNCSSICKQWKKLGGTIDHNGIFCFIFTEAPFYIATKTLLLFKKSSTIIPLLRSKSDVNVRHAHSQSISLIVANCNIMTFCSFASLVGGTCGPSPENPNVVHFVDSKIMWSWCESTLKIWNMVSETRGIGCSFMKTRNSNKCFFSGGLNTIKIVLYFGNAGLLQTKLTHDLVHYLMYHLGKQDHLGR